MRIDRLTFADHIIDQDKLEEERNKRITGQNSAWPAPKPMGKRGTLEPPSARV